MNLWSSVRIDAPLVVQIMVIELQENYVVKVAFVRSFRQQDLERYWEAKHICLLVTQQQ
jgi:hypothetical protein